MQSIEPIYGVLTVELDPTAPDFPLNVPAPLTPEDASELAQWIARDLSHVLEIPSTTPVGVALAAALYDQAELIQPDFPLFEALKDLYKGTQKQEFSPQILALGTHDGGFPIAVLNPRREIAAGPLFCIPFALLGPSETISTMDDTADIQLLEKGTASEETHKCLKSLFSVAPANLTYITLPNLIALYQSQMENFGLAFAWEVFQQALFRTEQEAVFSSTQGNLVVWQKKQAYIPFKTWKQFSTTKDANIDEYVQYLIEQRQLCAVLNSHHVTFHVVPFQMQWADQMPETIADSVGKIQLLTEDYMNEVITAVTPSSPQGVSEQYILELEHDALGLVAFSLVEEIDGEISRLVNYYPLTAAGNRKIMSLFSQQEHVKQTTITRERVNLNERPHSADLLRGQLQP